MSGHPKRASRPPKVAGDEASKTNNRRAPWSAPSEPPSPSQRFSGERAVRDSLRAQMAGEPPVIDLRTGDFAVRPGAPLASGGHSPSNIPASWLDELLLALLDIPVTGGENEALTRLAEAVSRILPDAAVAISFTTPDDGMSTRDLDGQLSGLTGRTVLVRPGEPAAEVASVTMPEGRFFPNLLEEREFRVPELRHPASVYIATDDSSLVAADSALVHFGVRVAQVCARLLTATRRHRIQQAALRGLDHMTEHLEQTEKLATLGEIAAGVVHELNNPLTAILAYTEFLQRRSPIVEQEPLARIHTSATRMLRVTRDLMVFARPSGEAREPVSIDALLERAIGFCEHVVRAANGTVEHESPDTVPLLVVRAHELVHVFVNLITNAAHALPADGGRIRVATRLVGNEVEVSVGDNGCGIAEDSLDQIFVPFFTTKPEGKGTGLGLSIVRRIVAAHEGRIFAESHAGLGHGLTTRFVVRLPVGNA